MPVLTYTNTRNDWSELGDKVCRPVHDALVTHPLTPSRPRLHPLEIDVHPGRSSTIFIPKRGTVQVNGHAPSRGVPGRSTLTPMHTGIGMTTEAVPELAIGLIQSQQLAEIRNREEEAENELNTMLLVLTRHCAKMQRRAVTRTQRTKTEAPPKRRTRIHAYSRAS